MKTIGNFVAVSSAEQPLPLSIPSLFILWGGLLLLIQQVERFFLFPTTLSIEIPTPSLIIKTLVAGLAQDLTVTGGALAVGTVFALAISLVAILFSRRRTVAPTSRMFATCLKVCLGLIALALAIIMMVDMSYYHWNNQRMNFVFFEYVADFLSAPVSGAQESQAAQQTAAEFENMGTWGVRTCVFLLLEGAALFAWWRIIHRMSTQKRAGATLPRPFVLKTVVAMIIALGTLGASPYSTSIQPLIESNAYFMLAQNPILFSENAARAALFHHWEWVSQLPDSNLSVDAAVGFYQSSRAESAVFPSQRYPLVGQAPSHDVRHFREPPNVVVIFVEALDRRYVGRTVHADRPIRVTPFLDNLKQDSVYFDNFYSNGVQTSRGLFATLCSYYPRHGAAAMKTRPSLDYLCLPSLLHERGYRTEMVVGQHGSVNNLRTFFTKNGIDRLYDLDDFPPHSERMGLGTTDAAIFDFITTRLRAGQSSGQPLFLAALTLSMHHPFVFPVTREEVKALHGEEDRYVPALRYFDSEFERFFTGLQRENLLKNTIVFVLGDHGRHEELGRTDVEKEVGHFLTPLFIWLDDSLRTDAAFRPRAVDTIASQVDVAPTILALTRSVPNLSPFVGHDVSCVLAGDCLKENTAYLTSVYDDLIGLVKDKGILLYSFRKERLYWTDLALRSISVDSPQSADVPSTLRELFSLYLTSNVLLEQNRIWSWPEFNEALYLGREVPPRSTISSLRRS
ncbi:MAG: LTA synthase family protein [Nitrospira sp.]|nr:LTA synthase family protein [Nitrospira sp.]